MWRGPSFAFFALCGWACGPATGCGEPLIVAERLPADDGARRAAKLEIDDLVADGDGAVLIWGEQDADADRRYWARLSSQTPTAITPRGLGGWAGVNRVRATIDGDGLQIAFQNHARKGHWDVYWGQVTAAAPAVDWMAMHELPAVMNERFQPFIARVADRFALAHRQGNLLVLSLVDAAGQAFVSTPVDVAPMIRPLLDALLVARDRIWLLSHTRTLDLHVFDQSGTLLGVAGSWTLGFADMAVEDDVIWLLHSEPTGPQVQRLRVPAAATAFQTAPIAAPVVLPYPGGEALALALGQGRALGLVIQRERVGAPGPLHFAMLDGTGLVRAQRLSDQGVDGAVARVNGGFLLAFIERASTAGDVLRTAFFSDAP